jgi:hypothetical protein
METMNEERLQKKKSSGKRIVDKKAKRVLDIGYHRVIAIKKDKDSLSSLLKKYDSIPSASGSSSILHIFSGEKKEVHFFSPSFSIISSCFTPLTSPGEIYETQNGSI